jgi:outer membrane protein OmpA-like peptidoglycan-associated protein
MKRMTAIATVLPVALVLLATGCATKKWVRQTVDQKETSMNQRVDQQFDQRDAKLGERIGTVEGRVTSETQRVDGVSQRVDGVSQRMGTIETSVGEANTNATGARETSNTALEKADSVDKRVTRLWSNRYNQKVVDTVDVYFRFDRSDLDDGAQTSLAILVKELQSNPGLTVELIGYTDTKGPREYNYQLSQRRVDAVRRFLVDKGVSLSRIQALGLGPVAASQTPEAQNRRVSAKLMIDQD